MGPIKIVAAASCAAAMLSPSGALALATRDWQMGMTIYGWFPSVRASTTFSPPPGSSGGSDISVDAADILENLKFVFMGSFEAPNGRWGGFTDLVYMKLGDSKSQTRDFLLGSQQVPADVSGKLDYELKSTSGPWPVLLLPLSLSPRRAREKEADRIFRQEGQELSQLSLWPAF